MKLLILTIILLSIAFAGIAIKIWAKKDGKFEGTCAGGNIRLKAEGIMRMESCAVPRTPSSGAPVVRDAPGAQA